MTEPYTPPRGYTFTASIELPSGQRVSMKTFVTAEDVERAGISTADVFLYHLDRVVHPVARMASGQAAR